MRELRGRIAQLGEASEIARTKPVLNGDEVMELLGLQPGPKVGDVLDSLLEEQIEGRIITREQAVAYVRQRYGSRGRSQ
jgi:poly(A) polymerase